MTEESKIARQALELAEGSLYAAHQVIDSYKDSLRLAYTALLLVYGYRRADLDILSEEALCKLYSNKITELSEDRINLYKSLTTPEQETTVRIGGKLFLKDSLKTADWKNTFRHLSLTQYTAVEVAHIYDTSSNLHLVCRTKPAESFFPELQYFYNLEPL